MLPPAVMQTTQKRIPSLVAPGITLCLIALLAGCTPPERTALEKGSRLLAGGNAEAALVELNKALEFINKNEKHKGTPNIMGHLHNQLGLAHQTLFRDTGKTNHYFQAHQAYKFTTTNLLTPPKPKRLAHLNLAWLYLERYDWNSNLAAFRINAGKAADEFNKLRVAMGDDQFPHWLEKGITEFHAGQLSSARESFRKAGQQDATALNGLGVLAAVERRYEAAAQHFEDASRVDAKDTKAKLHLAIALQSMGQYQSALDSYQAYLNVAPNSAAKKAQITTLVAGLEDYLKPEPKPEPKEEPKEEPVEKKPAEVAVVEPAEPEKPKEEEPEAKPVEVAVEEEPAEAVTPTEPIEEKPTEPEVAVAPAEVVPPKEEPEEPKEEPAEVIVIDPPVEEPKVVTPKPEEVVIVEPEEPKGLPVPEAKPAETVVPEESPEEPGAEPGTEVAVVEPPVERVEPAEPAAPEETEKPKKKWTDRLNPTRWFGGRKKDKTDDQISWKSSTPLPTIPAAKPVVPASTNATRVVNVLPTAVAYPRYAYLHPALPKAGDRQVAKTYFDDGAKAQKSKEWQRAKAAYLQATKSDPAWFEARFKLGQAAYYTGETGLALQSFENALSIDPNDGPARFNFAMSLVQGTYYADAAKELETFLQFDPNNIQAHLEAANLYAEKLHDVAKAAIHYKRVIGLSPEHPQAVNIRYWLIRNKAN